MGRASGDASHTNLLSLPAEVLAEIAAYVCPDTLPLDQRHAPRVFTYQMVCKALRPFFRAAAFHSTEIYQVNLQKSHPRAALFVRNASFIHRLIFRFLPIDEQLDNDTLRKALEGIACCTNLKEVHLVLSNQSFSFVDSLDLPLELCRHITWLELRDPEPSDEDTEDLENDDDPPLDVERLRRQFPDLKYVIVAGQDVKSREWAATTHLEDVTEVVLVNTAHFDTTPPVSDSRKGVFDVIHLSLSLYNTDQSQHDALIRYINSLSSLQTVEMEAYSENSIAFRNYVHGVLASLTNIRSLWIQPGGMSIDWPVLGITQLNLGMQGLENLRNIRQSLEALPRTIQTLCLDFTESLEEDDTVDYVGTVTGAIFELMADTMGEEQGALWLPSLKWLSICGFDINKDRATVETDLAAVTQTRGIRFTCDEQCPITYRDLLEQ